MDLRDGGGGDGLAELREDCADGLAKLLLDRLAGQRCVKGRQFVLQHAQLHGQIIAHHIRPGREHLPELDVGRTKRR